MIERVTRAVLLTYWMYLVVVTLLFQLLAKHSSAALPCKRFVSKHLHTHKQQAPISFALQL